MTTNRLPRVRAALLVGTLAVAPVAASIALAPSAAAIAVVDGEEPGFDADALADKGIAPLSLEVGDTADGVGDAEFLDEDGTVVEHADEGTGDLTDEDVAQIEPLDAEIMPISANVNEGLATGAIIAITVGGIAVVGGGVALGVRARRAKA